MAFAHYFVADIEADGPSPTENSMLSFASVAAREDGNLVGEFEAVLKPRGDKTRDLATMRWWETQPEAWLAATTNPKSPSTEIGRFIDWIESFDGKRSFAARPLVFYGVASSRSARWMTAKAVDWIEGIGGCVLIAMGVVLTTYERSR